MARVMVPGHKVCSSRSAQNAVANQAEVMPMSMQAWLLNWERGPEKMGLEKGERRGVATQTRHGNGQERQGVVCKVMTRFSAGYRRANSSC